MDCSCDYGAKLFWPEANCDCDCTEERFTRRVLDLQKQSSEECRMLQGCGFQLKQLNNQVLNIICVELSSDFTKID